MAIEKFWTGVSSSAFTTDGGTRGQITLTSTAGYKVKMDVIVTSGTQPTLELEVKRVVSGTLLEVGPRNDALSKRTDITAYTTGDGAAITANLQPRVDIPLKDIGRAVYEEEPTIAIRVVQVDQFGNILGGTGGVASDVNVRDGFGNAITSTTEGADQCLDIYVCNPDLDVDIFGIDGGGTRRQILTDSSGRIITSEMPGTEADAFSDSGGDGLISLTAGPDTLISIAHTSGTYHVSGWRIVADESVQFTLEVADAGVTTEILDVTMAGDVRPGEHINFSTPIEVTGAAGRTIRVQALRLKGGTPSGQAGAGINGFTTT